MSLAEHCDGPACTTWHRTPSDLPHDWPVVHEGGTVHHFCSWDCLLRFGAQVEPMTTVEAA